jgi:hypothetical protein
MTSTAVANSIATISTTAARLAMGAIVSYQILLIVLIFLRPDLDPSWHTISEWAIGQHGWIMSGAFLISALSYAGIARLHWYCEPLRHPKRPGLTLARCPLIAEAITAGASHVAAGPFCLHAVAITPAGLMELIRSYFSINVGLPQLHGGSAPALIVSRPAQRSLTVENPGYGIGLLGTALRNSTR